MATYGAMKARITENQTQEDFLVYNADDPETVKIISQSKASLMPFSRLSEPEGAAAFVRDEKIVLRGRDGAEHIICGIKELRIPGMHNLENALAAAACAFCGGIDAEVIAKVLREFKGVEHRMELAGVIDGVRFVNDSKGTNPDASKKALDAVDGGIILIAGGYDKHADFAEFIRYFGGRVKHLLLMGETKEKIRQAAEAEGFTQVTVLEDLPACVRLGFEIAKKGDTVLLSPASASWDMYKSYEERGKHFKEIVTSISSLRA
jgi:UDP-N-acetylmuramoylalanine--D-glutamate ligase